MATIDEKKLAEVKETYKQLFGIDPDIIDGMAQFCLAMTNEWEKILEKRQKEFEKRNKENHYGLLVPPEYEHLFEPNKKVVVAISPRYFGLFKTIRESNKFINYYKNFQHRPNGGFKRGKNEITKKQ